MRSAVDLTTCDREPIHIPGSIQPHGYLLVPPAGADGGAGVGERERDHRA